MTQARATLIGKKISANATVKPPSYARARHLACPSHFFQDEMLSPPGTASRRSVASTEDRQRPHILRRRLLPPTRRKPSTRVRNGSWRQRPTVTQRSDKEPFAVLRLPASITIIARWRWTNKTSSREIVRQPTRCDPALVSNGQTIRARHCRSSCQNFEPLPHGVKTARNRCRANLQIHSRR